MISKSYKDRRNFSTASYIEKKCGRKNPINPEGVVKNPRQTKTIRRLTDFFVAEYQLRGVAGLPVNMEEVDPSYTDDEYEAKVIAQYCNKPENYEDLLRSQNHNPRKYGTVPRPRRKKAKSFHQVNPQVKNPKSMKMRRLGVKRKNPQRMSSRTSSRNCRKKFKNNPRSADFRYASSGQQCRQKFAAQDKQSKVQSFLR